MPPGVAKGRRSTHRPHSGRPASRGRAWWSSGASPAQRWAWARAPAPQTPGPPSRRKPAPPPSRAMRHPRRAEHQRRQAGRRHGEHRPPSRAARIRGGSRRRRRGFGARGAGVLELGGGPDLAPRRTAPAPRPRRRAEAGRAGRREPARARRPPTKPAGQLRLHRPERHRRLRRDVVEDAFVRFARVRLPPSRPARRGSRPARRRRSR